MAIAKMEKITFVCNIDNLDKTMHFLQGFQGVQIEESTHSTIPTQMKESIDAEIRSLEKTIKEIQRASNTLIGRDRPNALTKEESTISMDELTQKVQQSEWQNGLKSVVKTDELLTQNRGRRKAILQQLEELEIWQNLDFNPNDFKNLKKSGAVYGSIHIELQEDFIETLNQFQELGCHYELISANEKRASYLLVFHIGIKDLVEHLLRKFSFAQYKYPFKRSPLDTKDELLHEENRLVKEEKELMQQIVSQSECLKMLQLAEDYHLNLLMQKKMMLKLDYRTDIFAFQGWILSDHKEALLSLAKENLPESAYKINFDNIRKSDINDVPIELKNGKIISAFENLTKMYSLPRYNELDPTPFLTPFYFVFFGMMVADVGYGLMMAAVMFFAKKFMKLKRSTLSMIDFLFYLSFSVMGWGLIYGSAFGADLPFRVFSTRTDIISLIILSLCFGYIHIVFGLCLNVYIKLKNKYTSEAILESGWVIAFIGGAAMLVANMVLNSEILFKCGGILLAAGLAVIIIGPAFTNKKWYVGFFLGLYSLYGATSYLGDFVSYTRLMTLGVAGASVAVAFNTIIGYLPVIARFTVGILLAIALHTLNIFLSALSAYVHGIRLQFIEFFGKFYTGGARPFTPFKAAEKNVIIISNNAVPNN